MIRKIFITLLFLCLFTFSVSAEQTNPDKLYNEQFEAIGGNSIFDALPKQTKEYLNEFGINPTDSGWGSALSGENVFSHIWQFVKNGLSSPLKYGLCALAIILISSLLSELSNQNSASQVAIYTTTLACAAVIATPVISVINASVNAMQGCAVFMTSFVPVFAALLAASGSVAVSVSMSALLLGASQAVSFVSGFVVTPLMGGYLALSISSAASPIISTKGLAEGIKKLCFWIMSFVTTVFIGILSIQTALGASADSLSMRTAKFIVGSSVPVAGTVLSEALATVTASMGLLKSSVGLYGVVAIAIIFLPLLIELLLWRLSVSLNAVIAELFAMPKISSLLKSIDAVIAVLIGIILLTFAMFIISLTVVVNIK